MRSRLEPMKKVTRTLRNHRELILNWFRAKGAISAGIVEGLNNKVNFVPNSIGKAPKSYRDSACRISNAEVSRS